MRGLFITGTDTDIGKTFVTDLIARQLLAEGAATGIYKPACSGVETDGTGLKSWSDVEAHYETLNGDFERDRICPQCFEAPAAPPVAASLENRDVDSSLMQAGLNWWADRVEFLLVEGVGGWLCPLTKTTSIADFAQECGYPVLIVASRVLGTLNHTLLTIESVRARNLPIVGIVLNQNLAPTGTIAEHSNLRELTRLTNVPVLSSVEFGQHKMLRRVASADTIDWIELIDTSVN